MLNFKFTKEFSAIRKFHDLKASEAQLTLPVMCQVEHQKLNQVAAKREQASHTKQKMYAKPSKKYKQIAKQSTEVKSIPPNFDGSLSFSSKARNLAKQSRARK